MSPYICRVDGAQECYMNPFPKWASRADSHAVLYRQQGAVLCDQSQQYISPHLLAHSSTRAGKSVFSLACFRAIAARLRRM
jgi:hypothetical protein